MPLVDSHCHLDSPKLLEDRDAILERARLAGVALMLTIGTGSGPDDLECAVSIAEQYPQTLATVGVHPHDAAKAAPETWDRMRELLAHPKVVAVGEIGLDYHYDFAPRDVQRTVFTRQLELARDAGQPVVIHTREAWDDTLAILRDQWKGEGILHCFTGGPAEAERSLELGFYLSFGGVLTFPKAEELREAARLTPPGRILVETDAPYLAPVPHRGRRNEPSFVVETARKLAEVREVHVEEIERLTFNNFRRLCLRGENANRYTEGFAWK